jgi:hypothetical protein
LQIVGAGTIKFYANIQNWILLSQSQQRDRQIPKHFDY